MDSPHEAAYWLQRLRKVAAVLVVGLSLFYLGSLVARNVRQLDPAQLQLRWLPLLLSLLLYSSSTCIGGICWSLILAGLGYRQPLRLNLKAHLSANIAKYMPGYAWQILGKAYLCSAQGVPKGTIAVGILLEFAGVIVTGLWVACLLLPTAWLDLWSLGELRIWRWPCWMALSILLVSAPALLRWALEHWPRRTDGLSVYSSPLWSALLWMLAAWFALGLAVYMSVVALQPLALSAWPALTFSWAATSVLSLAIVFVPMGLGVKESALAFLLGLQMPTAVAAVVAVLTRVLSIVGEAIWFFIAQRL